MTVKKIINKVKIEADDNVQCIPMTVFTFPNTTIQQQPACPLEEQLPDQGLDQFWSGRTSLWQLHAVPRENKSSNYLLLLNQLMQFTMCKCGKIPMGKQPPYIKQPRGIQPTSPVLYFTQ